MPYPDFLESSPKLFKLDNNYLIHNGGKRVRTADLCNAIAALYQLSYTPLSCVSDDILIIGALSRLL